MGINRWEVEMGSGKRPKRDPGKIEIPRGKRVTSARDSANLGVGIAHNGDGSRRADARSQCRRFGLVHATAAAQNTRVGMYIWGDFNDPKVRIRSRAGELGDAPSQEARFFINERERLSGGRRKRSPPSR